MRKIGFVVNPIAGMGGAVGLKGTDGRVQEARDRGAVPLSPARALRFLASVRGDDLFFYTAGGVMGEDVLLECDRFSFKVVSSPSHSDTTGEDTCQACNAMIREGVDLIVFCGGDGTARDVFSVVGRITPVLGIPAGVKIYSGVFALTPEAAARVLSGNRALTFTDGEVMDVDEEQYRQGVLTTRLTGIALTPSDHSLCQSCKEVSFGDEEGSRQEIAQFITELMRDDTLYLLGAGSTTGAVASRLGEPKTLLGIDAFYQGTLVGSDLNEEQILSLLEKYPHVKIVLSPIGAQGFVLGRGNQQISRRVIEKAGIDSLIVVATPEKLRKTPLLYLDYGDPDLNGQIGDTIQVICGYRMAQRVRVGRTW